MDDKRNLFLAIALCAGIFVVWQTWLAPQPQAPTGPSAQSSPVADSEDRDDDRVVGAQADSPSAPVAMAGPALAPADGGVALGDGGVPAGVVAAAVAAPAPGPAVREKEQEIALETPDATFVFSSYGAALKRVVLKGEKFHSGKGKSGPPLEILRVGDSNKLPLLLSFPKSDFHLPAEQVWTVAARDAGQVVFRAESATAAVEKTFKLEPGRFRLRLDVAVENRSAVAQKHNLIVRLFGRQDPAKKSGGFFDYASASVAEMVCHVNGDVERAPTTGLGEDPVDKEGTARWVAADERFFAVALVAGAQDPSEVRRCGLRALDADTGEVFLSFAGKKVEPGQIARYPFAVFAGPKYRELLAEVTVPGAATGAGTAPAVGPAELDLLVNVNFAFLSRPLLALMKFFEKLTGNWGVAIILLTLVVRLVTFYPAHRQLLSGKRMARLAPKMAELKKKYEGDRERMGRETMSLYKAHGVNPLGGCVPALIQMPIWIALFSTLSYSVELYRSSFFLHIQDLSNPDIYYVSPLIMGVIMYLQMRMSPAGADPQQQKMMAVMMPIMFTGFSLFLPAGLALYTLTSYFVGILHQLAVNEMDKRAHPPDGGGGVVAKA